MVDVIELLNEPAGFDANVASVVRQFWNDGYNAVRGAIGGGVKVMIGDAFLGVSVRIFRIYFATFCLLIGIRTGKIL